MNLQQIATYTATKLGIADAATLEVAKAFARARWEMIWNHSLWRQTRHEATVAVPAGTQNVELPPEFELVHAVRWGNTQLLAGILDLSALANDPVALGTVGPVLGFSPLGKTAGGLARVRLHRTPNEAGTIFVVGKRTCIPLAADTDAPLLAGASECLCAYTMGDLMQWQRQLSKANAYFEEAGALLAKMLEIETAQTTEPRQLVPYTQQLEDSPGQY